MTLPAPAGLDRVTVTKPDGVKRDLKVNERGGAVFDDADETGIYQAEGRGFSYPFAANLASASESDTTPHKTLTITDNPTQTAGRKVADNWELLPMLALLALAVLSWEWWAFHRRSYVS